MRTRSNLKIRIFVIIGIILLLLICLLIFFCDSNTSQGFLSSIFEKLGLERNSRGAASGTTLVLFEDPYEHSDIEIIDLLLTIIDTDQIEDLDQIADILRNQGLITDSDAIDIAGLENLADLENIVNIENNQQLDILYEILYRITQNESDLEENIQEEIVPPIPPAPIPDNMTYIRGGTYYMGSPLSEDDRGEDEEQHLVTINAFYIGMYEVTQREYQEIMGTNPSYNKGQNLPVEGVNWFDAVEYCNKLSYRDRLTPVYTIVGSGSNRVVTWDEEANGYRLPTEAEWEYACRAGTTTSFNTGNILSRTSANIWGNRTRAVGSYPPNRWGLYDMHGNVAEWCWDSYIDFNTTSATQGKFSDIHRIFRGGNWMNTAMRARSAFRDHFYPTLQHPAVGFRVVRNVE